MAEMKAQGFLFGFAPYGYRYAKEVDAKGRRRLEEDPTQQEGLRRILALFDDGVTVDDITRKLNAVGIPKARGGTWHKTLVYRILKRAERLPDVIRPGPASEASGGAYTRARDAL